MTHPLLLKAQPLFKWLARAAEARAVISGFGGGGELETDEGKHVAEVEEIKSSTIYVLENILKKNGF